MSGWIQRGWACLAAIAALAGPASAEGERDAVRAWLGRSLLRAGRPTTAPAGPWIEVRRQDYHLGVRHSVMKTPLRLGGRTYKRGLGSHSTSEIVIHLPQAAERLDAVIGIDENRNTSGGRGSVVFVVEAGGKRRFQSAVIRGGEKPKAIRVPLGGARSVVLKILDAGDGPESDHGDWAEAAVTLQNGSRLWVDEIRMRPAPGRGLVEGIPFSFTYDGKSSSGLLGRWRRKVVSRPAGAGRRRHTVTWTDDETHLAVICEATVFADYPAVEWLLRLKNTGSKATPVLEDIQPLNLGVGVGEKETVVFHHAKGSNFQRDDYLPIAAAIAPGQRVSLPPEGSRSQAYLPYFNLEWQGGGLVGAIGWTGQWALSVGRTARRGVLVRAGQQRTHLKLLPGESIRTPRILLVHWRGGERLRGHNLLRRLLVAHYVPRIDGQVVMPPLAQNTWFTFGTGNGTTERNQVATISKMPAMGLEAFWLDAGWFEGGWPNGVGSWLPRKDHFPNGLRPVGDAAHKAGLKFIVWFEPERVGGGSLIARKHPRWVLSPKGAASGGGIPGGLFDLGNGEARRWMTEYLSKCIADWGIDVYRQDRNFYPYRIWRAHDAADRQGMTEIRHVEGLYAMWDELRSRHPGLVIDNANWRCTGPDLEVLMRSAGSWTCSETADGGRDAVCNQVQLCGLSLYVPLHASLLWGTDPYTVRSVARFGTSLSANTGSEKFSAAEMKRAAKEVRSLRPLYLGDYYPLTEVDLDEGHWCGWQFDRPDLGEGFAMFFRRAASRYCAMDAKLRGLDGEATYRVSFAETYDVRETRRMTGRELATLRTEIATAPGSLLVRYRRLGKKPASSPGRAQEPSSAR